MKSFTIVAAIGLALLVPSSAISVRSGNSISFVDPTGDSGTAPDISSATVSNDDQGVVTFSIGIANRPQLGPTDYVQVIADTDGLSSTGDEGFDVLIQVEGPETGLYVYDTSRWNRGDANSLHSSYANGLLTIEVGIFDLRAIGDLDFWFYSGTDHGGAGKEDMAPDGTALYSYTIKVPLLFDELEAPSSVKAGKTLDASMKLVTDSDAQGAVTCTAKIGATRLRGEPGWFNILIVPRDPNGGVTISAPIGNEAYAMCSFKVPKNAKGKVISATITAKRSGVVVSRTFSARIR